MRGVQSIAVALSVLLTGCGGGGGGGGGTSSPSPTAAFETGEYNAQYGLGIVRAAYSYLRGATGAGVSVAVIDTGLDTTHPDLAGRVAAGGFDFVANSATVTDPNGHGTHVTGLIAANRDGTGMHGVAYGAQVVPLRFLNAAGSGTSNDAALAYNRAVALGVRIINNSWGSTGQVTGTTAVQFAAAEPNLLAAVQNADTNNAISVFAAGNGVQIFGTTVGFANPTVEAGLPHLFPALADTWVAVVAVDRNGNLPTFSSQCGVAASWCIAAPGGGTAAGTAIYSTAAGGGYTLYSGTSMAAPQVSGALALLRQLFPTLTAQQIVARLFLAANRNGQYGNSTIFGQGLLDIERATLPLGSLGIAIAGGTLTGLGISGLSFGPAFGNGLEESLAGRTMVVFDSVDRATFAVRVGDLARPTAAAFSAQDRLPVFGLAPRAQSLRVGRAEAAFAFAATASAPAAPSAVSAVTLSLPTYTGPRLSLSYATDPALAFRMGDTAVAPQALAAPAALAVPYLQLFDRAVGAAAATSFGTVRAGAFVHRSDADDIDAGGGMVELRTPPIARGTLALQFGTVFERDTVLGTRGTGAFATDGGTRTTFWGVTADLALAPRLRVIGAAYQGATHTAPAGPSLIDRMSTVASNAVAVGVVANDLWAPGDRAGVIANQPLRVTKGTATLSLATGMDGAGQVSATAVEAGLSPSGREIDLQAFYQRTTGALTLSASALVLRQPGHVRANGPEAAALVRLQLAF